MDDVYSSLFDDLRTFFKAQDRSEEHHEGLNEAGIAEQNLFLPGFEGSHLGEDSADGAGKSIQTALLISTSVPSLSTFSSRLVSEISSARSTNAPTSIVVTLSASECSNLYTALRLLVARFIAQGPQLDDSELSDIEAAAFAGKVEPDLHVLRSWWQDKYSDQQHGPRLVLNLPTIEAVEPTVLSDLLSALQTFVAEPSSMPSPQLMLVLGITSPSGGLASVSSTGIGSSSNSASAPAPWIDYIPRSVLRVLDISRFSLPSKESVWSRLVQGFLTSRDLPLSLGPSTFEYIRETYWERDADLDSLLDAVRLAYFVHFSGKAESVFTIPGQAKGVKFFSWTPKMVERMKMAFLTADGEGNLVLPLLTDSIREASLDVPEFLSEAARSDQFILGQLDQLRHPREVLCFRIEFAVRFLFRAFEALQRIQSRASTAAQAMHAARNSTVAAQQAAEMDEHRQLERASEILTQVVMQCLNASVGSSDGRGRRVPAALTLKNGLARLCNAARRLLSDEFETLLDDMVSAAEEEVNKVEDSMADSVEEASQPGQLRTSCETIASQSRQFLAELRTFQQRLSQTILAGTAGLNEEDGAELPAATSNGTEGATAAQQKREARLQRVQRKLLMEEKLLGLKREITDYLTLALSELVDWRQLSLPSSPSPTPLHLLRDIFWVDAYGPLSTLLDPSTRAGLTLPLAEPIEFVESLYDAALSVVPEEELEDEGVELKGLKRMDVPDTCRLYQLYRECGKFVNLADWYDAFKQGVELDDKVREVERELRGEELQGPAEPGAPSETDGDVDEEGDEAAEPETPSKRQTSRRKRSAQPMNLAESDYESDVPDTPSKKRTRKNPSTTEETKATETSESELQGRFALALNELARMGMIRGTRRRQEHITKVMWDLVPESF